jgi:hypothetical protein
MRRRMFILATVSSFAALFAAGISRAQTWSLITKEEYDREVAWSRDRKPSSVDTAAPPAPGAPTIDIQQPDQNRPIKSPVTVVIAFSAQPGSKIDPSSIRVWYGFLKLDITDKIKQYAKIDESGMRADNAQLPVGTHNVIFSISDNKGRVASRAVVITVV